MSLTLTVKSSTFDKDRLNECIICRRILLMLESLNVKYILKYVLMATRNLRTSLVETIHPVPNLIISNGKINQLVDDHLQIMNYLTKTYANNDMFLKSILCKSPDNELATKLNAFLKNPALENQLIANLKNIDIHLAKLESSFLSGLDPGVVDCELLPILALSFMSHRLATTLNIKQIKLVKSDEKFDVPVELNNWLPGELKNIKTYLLSAYNSKYKDFVFSHPSDVLNYLINKMNK